jgi:ABC-2 type transport system permease protein
VIRVEFIRQLRRTRTWACFAALAAVPTLIAVANRVQGTGRERDINIFTQLTKSGINLGVVALLVMSNFFLVVVVAAFAGESVSGEATWGTLRYLLIRPVSRFRVLFAKMFVAYVLTVIATLVVTVTGVAVGTACFGWHNPIVLQQLQIGTRSFSLPVQISALEGLGRLTLASAYVALFLLVVVAVGMFLSTLTDSTAAAVVGTIVVIVSSAVLENVPSLRFMKPVLPTHFWGDWTALFTGRSTSGMWGGVIATLVYTALFSVMAVARFQRKDILS